MLSFSLISCHHDSGFSYTCLYYTSSKKYSGIVFLFTVFKYYMLPWQMNLNVCSNKNTITTHSINLIQSNFASCYFLEAVILPHILSAEQESMLLPVDLLWHLSGFYITKPDVNPLDHPKHLDKKKSCVLLPLSFMDNVRVLQMQNREYLIMFVYKCTWGLLTLVTISHLLPDMVMLLQSS